MKSERRFAHKGVNYHVLAWTPEVEDGSRAPLVLLHGFAQSAHAWDEIAPQLARGRAVYALDLIGQGKSDRPDDTTAYTLEEQGEALLAFLTGVEAVGCGAQAPHDPKPVVVGYSMGGRVALAAACRRPQAFGGLVLESAGLGPADERERAAAAERDARSAAVLRRDGLTAFMNHWEQLPLFATQRELPAAARERLRAGRLANDAVSLACVFEKAGQHTMPDRKAVLGCLHALAESGTPVLYVAGARDEKYRAFAQLLCDNDTCATHLIENAGHNVHLEAPERYVCVLEGFLDQRSG